jgi:hypothetical protein
MEEGKIKYLFDSSAILDLIKLGEKALDRAIQGSFANCNISVDLDLFKGGITEYI